jgi:hypothetical protein
MRNGIKTPVSHRFDCAASVIAVSSVDNAATAVNEEDTVTSRPSVLFSKRFRSQAVIATCLPLLLVS